MKGAGTAFLTLALGKAGLRLEDELYTLEETRLVMGSAARIIGVGTDKGHLKSAVDAAFSEMKRLERLMTIFDGESEISQLNRYGRARLSPDCIEVLRKSLYISSLTQGAFDVTLGAYTNLWVEDTEAGFKKTGAKVDLGGIGIGYAVDRAVEILRFHGVKSALVDGGGEVKTLGSKSKDMSWKIGIRDPNNKQGFIEVLKLDDCSVSTSGNYERMHIIDPETGSYPSGLSSVSIISKEAVYSDAISTAAYVLGIEKGLSLIEKIPGIEGLFLTTKGEVLKTKGLSKHLADTLRLL